MDDGKNQRKFKIRIEKYKKGGKDTAFFVCRKFMFEFVQIAHFFNVLKSCARNKMGEKRVIVFYVL